MLLPHPRPARGAPRGGPLRLILRRCLPRFAELFDRHGVRATFFVVGRDLEEDPEGRRLLEQLAAAGHELANHSYAHPYELTRLPAGAHRRGDRSRPRARSPPAPGRAPVGFRAPGYETSAEVIDLLVERGYAYDSSAFPAGPVLPGQGGGDGARCA